ncbi:MAG: type II toxin-antitoxin system HigB family toxin [Gammaproteobacteria bacterium]|nr:type II toxin-antitoxin system HigB family toxin [Gammaproteobacteria bacterium]
MHVISRLPFLEAARRYPNQRQAPEDVYRVLRRGGFDSPEDMRWVFPSLDNFRYRDKWWVIDVGGDQLRMIAFIQFVQRRIYVKHIVTHAEYDRLCRSLAKSRR